MAMYTQTQPGQIFSPDAFSQALPVPLSPAPMHDEMSVLEMPSYTSFKSYESYAALYASHADDASTTGTDATASGPGALRLRTSPTDDSCASDASAACISTSQVFELADDAHSDFGDYSSYSHEQPGIPEEVPTTGSKRASPFDDEHSSPPKKARAPGERIRCKDFVPPDVSGLSKREARLVKNRAAAFLSRQRKREEFEHMEVRVAKLEEENARLRNQTTGELVSEVEQLKAQLAAAEARAAAIPTITTSSLDSLIKMEPMDDDEDHADHVPSPASTRSRSSSVSSSSPRSDKNGASLGLMVLLCSLPTLLANGGSAGQNSLPTRFSLPMNAASSPFAFSDLIKSPAFNSLLELESEQSMTIDPFAPTQPAGSHLAFADGASLGLNNLDIAFDAQPGEDGKIRVRILPSNQNSAQTSRAASPFASSEADPVLGAPAYFEGDEDMGLGWGMPGSSYGSQQSSRFGSPVSSEWSAPASKKRVRIALKSMPAAGGEGGEWEVEVC